jgi:hypothetical protein
MVADGVDDDVEWIRAAATRLGMPMAEVARADAFESADAFIERMKQGHSPARRRWRRLAIGATTAAAAAVAITVVVVLPASHDPAAADTPPILDFAYANGSEVATIAGRPAAEALRDLARIARASGDRVIAGGTQEVVTSGWFAQLDSAAASDSARLVPTVERSRLDADGVLTMDSQHGRKLTSGGHLVQGVTSAPTAHEVIAPGTFDPGRAVALGSDTAKVRSILLEHAGCEAPSGPAATACLFREVIALSHQWVLPGPLTAALWEILAEQPDVRSLGKVEDRAGRPGVGFAIDLPGPPHLRSILIVSRDDGRLLGSEEVLTEDDPDTKVQAPAVYSFTTIVKSHWIASR